MRALHWVALPKDAAEPDPGAIVLTGEDVWVNLIAPGRDGWYRVGGGRGPSTLLWEDLHDPDRAMWIAVQPEPVEDRGGRGDPAAGPS